MININTGVSFLRHLNLNYVLFSKIDTFLLFILKVFLGYIFKTVALTNWHISLLNKKPLCAVNQYSKLIA